MGTMIKNTLINAECGKVLTFGALGASILFLLSSPSLVSGFAFKLSILSYIAATIWMALAHTDNRRES